MFFQLDRFRYGGLPFWAIPVWDMLQKKIDERLKEQSNVFDIADDILVVGYDDDGTKHDRGIREVLRYVEKNLK